MERLIYAVSPAYSGWQLCEQGEQRNWFPDKRTALLAADQLADLRNARTGRPTAVKVQMSRDGDWVMIGSRG